jgi:predicted transcriptional regulator YdeE
MQTTIVTRPAFKVVGIRIRVKAMSPEIPALWGRFVPRIAEIRNPAEPDVAYGLMGNFDEATQMLDYMAGISVTDPAEIPEGMEAWEVPAATCAVFETNLATIHETVRRSRANGFQTPVTRKRPEWPLSATTKHSSPTPGRRHFRTTSRSRRGAERAIFPASRDPTQYYHAKIHRRIRHPCSQEAAEGV